MLKYRKKRKIEDIWDKSVMECITADNIFKKNNLVFKRSGNQMDVRQP